MEVRWMYSSQVVNFDRRFALRYIPLKFSRIFQRIILVFPFWCIFVSLIPIHARWPSFRNWSIKEDRCTKDRAFPLLWSTSETMSGEEWSSWRTFTNWIEAMHQIQSHAWICFRAWYWSYNVNDGWTEGWGTIKQKVWSVTSGSEYRWSRVTSRLLNSRFFLLYVFTKSTSKKILWLDTQAYKGIV